MHLYQNIAPHPYTNAPGHPQRLTTAVPRTADEFEALLQRGRTLRARAIQALWLRFGRRWRRRIRVVFGAAPQHHASYLQRCRT